MRTAFSKIYFFNPKQLPQYSNEQKRIQRLLLINYFLVFSIPVIIINDIILAITGDEPYTFEKYPVLIYWFFTLLALWLTKRKMYLGSKLIVVFFTLVFISSYSITGYVIGEHFLWQPIAVLGISVIPYLVFDVNREKTWLIISFFTFLIYIILHDQIMLSGTWDDNIGRVYDRLDTNPFIHTTVKVIIFFFLVSVVFYSLRLSDHQHTLTEKANESLKKTSDNLERLNAELQAQRNAINNSASMLIVDASEKIISVNDNFLRASGYDQNQLVGNQFSDLVVRGQDRAFYDDIISTVQGGKVWRGEIRLPDSGNNYFWMETAISNIYDSDNSSRGILVIMFNISNLKNHEERLERLNLEKDRILYAVAHDLKNPLLNFKALLDIVNSGNMTEEEQQKIFKLMTRDCEHSVNLISELLDIGRLEDEKYVLEKKPAGLHQFLEKAMERFDQSVENKKIRLVKEFESKVDTVEINENEFVRVIYNLLSNAIKFTPQGGEITVTTRSVDGKKVEIAISDTGVGISEELLPIIFDKFSKAGRKGIKGEKSTGLGMWIVRHIVKLHGGQISVESQEYKGTKFTIVLPVSGD
jgi:PAS domain S-box-containing protein